MTTLTHPGIQPVAIPVRGIPPWAIFAGLLFLLGIYFVGVEEGVDCHVQWHVRA